MSKFRKKPVEVEALHMPGEKRSDVLPAWSWINDGGGRALVCHHPDIGWGLMIETLEGDMEAKPGDWIIRGVQGEFYPCKPDIFEATYEAVEGCVHCGQPRDRHSVPDAHCVKAGYDGNSYAPPESTPPHAEAVGTSKEARA